MFKFPIFFYLKIKNIYTCNQLNLESLLTFFSTRWNLSQNVFTWDFFTNISSLSSFIWQGDVFKCKLRTCMPAFKRLSWWTLGCFIFNYEKVKFQKVFSSVSPYAFLWSYCIHWWHWQTVTQISMLRSNKVFWYHLMNPS